VQHTGETYRQVPFSVSWTSAICAVEHLLPEH